MSTKGDMVNAKTEPYVRFVRVKKGAGWEHDIYEARTRMPDGKTLRWTQQINTFKAYPQEQAAQLTLYYAVPGYGEVRYPMDATNYILERMETDPEEFVRMYVRT